MRLAAAVAVLLLAVPAFAADVVTGKWKASAPGPDGQTMEIVFTLKAEGATLTGTSATSMGELPISNGKIDGDKVSFDVTPPGMGKITHKGTVKGDTMTLAVEFGDSGIPPMDMTATRVVEKK